MTSTVHVWAIWLLCAVRVDLRDAIAYELVHLVEIRDHLRGETTFVVPLKGLSHCGVEVVNEGKKPLTKIFHQCKISWFE